jgi:hypothetical protein
VRKVVSRSAELKSTTKAKRAVAKLRVLADPVIAGERGAYDTDNWPGCILMRAFDSDDRAPDDLANRFAELLGRKLTPRERAAVVDITALNDISVYNERSLASPYRKSLESAVRVLEKAAGLR